MVGMSSVGVGVGVGVVANGEGGDDVAVEVLVCFCCGLRFGVDFTVSYLHFFFFCQRKSNLRFSLTVNPTCEECPIQCFYVLFGGCQHFIPIIRRGTKAKAVNISVLR